MSQQIPIRKFSFRTIVFSVIITILVVLFQWLCPRYASPALPFIVLFFFLITLITLYIVLRSNSGTNGKKFVSGYMLSRIIKLFSCLLFLILYDVLNKKDAVLFSISFFVIYFAYSLFEVFVLKKENDDIKKRQQRKNEASATSSPTE